MKEKPVIMIVDDDPNIAQLVRLYLEKDGYPTVVASRGDEAMELFRQNGPADAFSRIFNKVVRFVPEDIFQILSHGDVRAPFRGMDAVFVCLQA